MDNRVTVKAALDRLGVPGTDAWEDIEPVALERIGQNRLDAFLCAEPEERPELVLEDFGAATSLGLGWRRFEFEAVVPWLMAQVKDGQVAPESVILDVGAGTGFTAALMSVAAQRRAIATEVVPSALRVITELAHELSADVQAVLCGVGDISRLTAGGVVDTIVLQRVLPYLDVPHNHHPSHFWVEAVNAQYWSPEYRGTVVEEFLRGSRGARQILIVDWMCPETWAALIALAAESGFELDLKRSQSIEIQGIDDSTTLQALRFFRCAAAKPVPAGVLMDLLNHFLVENEFRGSVEKLVDGGLQPDAQYVGWEAERLLSADWHGEWYASNELQERHGRLLVGLFKLPEGVWSFITSTDGNRVLRREGATMEEAIASVKGRCPDLKKVDNPVSERADAR